MKIYFPAQALEDSDCSDTKKQLLEELVRFTLSVFYLEPIIMILSRVHGAPHASNRLSVAQFVAENVIVS